MGLRLTKHAKEEFKRRAETLGFRSDTNYLNALLNSSRPETKMSRFTRWQLFKRRLLHGDARSMTNKGWRFVIDGNEVVTVERIKPHENAQFKPIYD